MVKEDLKSEEQEKDAEKVEEDSDDDDIEDYIPTPPDGGYGWMIVLCSFMCNLIVDGIGYAFGVLLPEFVAVFNESRSKVSLMNSLLCGVYLCAGPVVSGLTNKFGCRPVAIAGSIVAFVGFLISSFSKSINILILTYGVMGGFGFGLIYLPSIVSVGYYFEKKRAMATGIAVCGSGVGTFLFSPVNDILLKMYSWQGLLMIHAAIILQCAVCGMLMRPLEPASARKKGSRKKELLLKGQMEEAKEMAQENGRQRGESESSTVVAEQFAKLQEAKLAREKRLNDVASEVSSMPSIVVSTDRGHTLSFSEKRDQGSNPSSPSHGPASPTHGSHSPFRFSKHGGSSHKMSGSRHRVHLQSERDGDGQHLPGVVLHEVHPLIDNGYAKQRKQHHPHLGSGYVGSHRSIALKEDLKRPLYRKDIFYSGSIAHIPQFQSQPDMRSYVTSITSIPGDLGVEEKESCFDKWTCLPKPVVDTFKEMLDVSLLTNLPFALICIGNIFGMIGFYVPFAYIVDRAVLLDIERTEAAFLLSVIGITNTIGRVLAGFLADLEKMDALVINNVALVIAAIILYVEPFCVTYTTLIVFSAIYGLAVAAYISLSSIILCDLLGLEKLTNAFGLLTLCRGVAGVAGPPFAGFVYEEFQSYDASFIMGGIMFTIGAGFHLLLHLPCIKRRENKDQSLEMMDKKKNDVEIKV